MKNKNFFYFSILNIILYNLYNCIIDYPPNKYQSYDIFFDKNNPNYHLVALKYFTSNNINDSLHITGHNLDKEISCNPGNNNIETFNAYGNYTLTSISYKQIYENAIYYTGVESIICSFPEPVIKNNGYKIYHNIMIFNPITNINNRTLKISFGNKEDNFINVCEIENFDTNFFKIKIEYDSKIYVYCNSDTDKIEVNGIKYIKYFFEADSTITTLYSPAVAMYINYEEISQLSSSQISDGYLSVIGYGICDRDLNPCVAGYTCIGGTCVKCDDACFDCQRGNSNTHCESKCNVIATTFKPNLGKCEIGYIDITNFQGFNINNIDYPDTNRLTVSLWFYLSSLCDEDGNKKNGKEHITFLMSNYFNFSLIYSIKDSTQNLIISIFVQNEIIENITISEDDYPNYFDNWIYIKFGISYDHNENLAYFTYVYPENDDIFSVVPGNQFDNIYLNMNIDGTLKNISSGYFYKHYYRNGDYENFQFEHLQSSDYMKIYIRELLIFKEYLPNPYDIKDFQLEKFIISSSELPELLIAMPFDNLLKNSQGYYTNIYTYKSTKREINIQLSLNYKKKIDFEPPRTFKRLNLLTEPNVKYSSPDFINKQNLAHDINKDLFLYDDNKPFSCINGYYLNLKENYYECDIQCPINSYSNLFGLSTEKGFCNYNCDIFQNSKCLYHHSSLRNIKSEFDCIDGYTNLFYKCIETSNLDKYFFYYNSKYSPSNIIFDFSSYDYSSYFVDFWFFPDETEQSSYSIDEKYIFYMNSMKISVKKTTNGNSYNFISDVYKNEINNLFKYEWNRINLKVYYDPHLPKNKKTKFYFGINNNYNNLNGESENKYILKYIYFCNGDASNCNGLNLKWASGFYKKLRVYNGNKANIDLIRRYDNIFSTESSRINGMIAYYPLYGKYIINNYLSQGLTLEAGMNITESNNIWGFPQYNLGINFDYVNAFDKNGMYIDNSKILKNCSDNCLRCFEVEKCYECKHGYYLLENGSCQMNSNYVLKLPSSLDSIPITKNEIHNSNSFTITFWIKLFGFLSSNSINDIIKYSDNLKLNFDSSEGSPNYGLNLVFYSGSAINYISNYYNFRNEIGLWTFISVAYYDSTTISHFPQMAKFEINTNSMNITGSLPSTISLGPISFNNLDMFALIKNLKIYETFLVGAYVYETDTAKNGQVTAYLFKTLFDVKTTEDECLDLNEKKYKCVPDSQYFLKLNYNYQECNFVNHNKNMFFGSLEFNFCYQYDYTNFARAKEITQSVGSASSTKKFTMHFWVFVYPYVNGSNFKGIQMEWTYHQTISIIHDSSYTKFYFECKVPSIDGTFSYQMLINLGEWNFLHCAIDAENNYFYMNTYESKYSIDYSSNYIPGSNTKLIIKDLSLVDWGVLFYRNIRLWKDCFPNVDFLSMINIKNGGYNNLLHQWNTNYNSNNKVEELADNSKSFTVDYNDKIGSNIVDNTKYKTFSLCEDPGQFYDKKTGKCINFINLSKLQLNVDNNIEFENVQLSFNHNYGIAFWILYEDPTKIISGTDVTWDYHMKISLQYHDDNLNAYCYPQNYYPYKDYLDNKIDYKDNKKRIEKVKNYLRNTITSPSNWIWIQCFLNYQGRQFYLNENEGELLNEILYTYNEENYLNIAPYGYFFNNIPKKKDSSLKITLSDFHDTKIFIRCLYLFKDYLPYNYNFRYMDLSKTIKYEFPPLLFAINFADYDIDNNNIGYKMYDSFTNNIDPESNIKKQLKIKPHSDLILSSNFNFLPLCDFTKNEKYNSDKNICEEIISCDKEGLNALYCMDENIPIYCKENYYINIDENDNTLTCQNSCNNHYFRTPGTTVSRGICSNICYSTITEDLVLVCPNTPNGLTSYQNTFACKDSYLRIGYQCYNIVKDSLEQINRNEQKGALFYSRCNNPYNIYHSFSTSFIEKIKQNGYILEFWFILDNVYCKSYDDTDNPSNEYTYFLSYPHRIYNSNSKWIYEFNLNQKIDITKYIHKYEWNKIIIMVNPKNFQINIIVNFDQESIEELNYIQANPSNFYLNKIGFCSSLSSLVSNDCELFKNVINLKWGSAFYNNLRIWDYNKTSIQTIQDYITGVFTEIPQNIFLYYPMTIQYLDNNIISNILPNFSDDISYSISTDLYAYNKDNILIYNYANNFDWAFNNKKKFISDMDNQKLIVSNCNEHCLRCYEESLITKCYECDDKYTLINQTCFYNYGYYYLKTPSPSQNDYSFILDNGDQGSVSDLNGWTISFWMKFIGVIYSSESENPKIFSLSGTTYLAYNNKNNTLVIKDNSQTAFEDFTFSNNIGQWIPIQIANYKSNNFDVYPHMFTLMVNKTDISLSPGYVIPENGIHINSMSFGSEIIAFFADLRVYNKFIFGAYGTVVNSEEQTNSLFKHYPLIGTSNDNCIIPSNDLTDPNVGVKCVQDYNQFLETTCYCEDKKKYLEFVPFNDSKDKCKNLECFNCNENCNELCFNPFSNGCTCDITKGVYWLRKDINQNTYCEKIPFINFGNIDNITLNNAPVTKTLEYTIELWLYIYSYNTINKNFRQLFIEWNYHNKLTIYHDTNIRVKCEPIFDSTSENSDKITDNSLSSFSYYKWNFIKCGTDLNNLKYFFMNNEINIKTNKKYLVNFDSLSDSNKIFKIYRSNNFLSNFGFIFLRDIKLWQQYNFNYIDSKYILFDSSNYHKFPGLLWYFKNLYEEIDSELKLKEELSGTQINLNYDNDYIGYNYVNDQYKDLILCNLGEYYNDDINGCSELINSPVEHCENYANKNYQCLNCKDDEIYLLTSDGSCHNDCSPYYFGNELINQCRRCHSSCYSCTGKEANQCLSCTGNLYFYEKEKTCIENCEIVGLTKSLTRNNMCVEFDASASLINVNEIEPIDANNFNYIQAIVIDASSPDYETLWKFYPEKTNEINNELGFSDSLDTSDSPFIGDLSLLNTPLNTSFFKIGHKYVFGLDIIKENNGYKITINVQWVLKMNSPPKNGKLTVIPEIGLRDSTTFIITCTNFIDENTNNNELEYFFYYIEHNTTNQINLTNDWTSYNEVYTNFSVRYYQQESTKIDIYCLVRDRFLDQSYIYNTITIINKIGDKLYNLSQILSYYSLDNDYEYSDMQLLARAEYLMSIGLNPYRDLQPNIFYTKYENSIDGLTVSQTDPNCVETYCNLVGECHLIDISLGCYCESGYIGSNCHIDSKGYTKLAFFYNEIYEKIFLKMKGNSLININLFNAMYDIFFSAQNFFQDNDFFDVNLDNFVTFLRNENSYIISNKDNINKLFDLSDFYFQFYYNKLIQKKLNNKISSGISFRNVTLTKSQETIYEKGFKKIINMIEKNTEYLIKNYHNEYSYSSNHFNYYLLKISQSFKEDDFFKANNNIKKYKPYFYFMKCLQTKHQSFNYYLNYIEYLQTPTSYDSTYYPFIVSPFISINIYDINGKKIEIDQCSEDNQIKIYLPFNSYNWLNYINEQKKLFLPENYKLPTDPIFKDPIYIDKKGFVSDDTVEKRIEEYYRYYNIVGIYYTPEDSSNLYSQKDINFIEYTNESNYLVFHSTHLTSFTSMLIDNVMEFKVDGRFFFLKKTQLFKYKGNYKSPGFIFIILILILFILACLIYYCYDHSFYEKEELLDFLKKEIIKVHFPYNQFDFGDNDKNIEKLIPKYKKDIKRRRDLRNMFDDINIFEKIKELNNEKDNKSEQNNKETNFNNIDNNSIDISIYKNIKNNKLNLNENNNKEENITDKNINIESIKINNPPKKKTFFEEKNDSKNNNIFVNESLNSNSKKEMLPIFVKKKKNKNNSIKNMNENDDPNSHEKLFDKRNNKINNFNKKTNQNFIIDSENKNIVSLSNYHNSLEKSNENEDLPEDIENEKENKKRAIENYSNLNCSTYNFIKWNLNKRHILFGPILNRNIFNHRWKKFFVLTTQIYTNMFIISLLLTNDENINSKNKGKIISTTIITEFISNLTVYMYEWLFITSTYQRTRMFHLVMNGRQLHIIKAWNRLKKINLIKTIIGIIFCLIIWIINFFITFGFLAVWKNQRNAWITIFILSEFLDLVLCEIIMEIIVGLFFHKRKSYMCIRDFGEWINRFRGYRSMYP